MPGEYPPRTVAVTTSDGTILIGQKAATASLPVVLANDQGAVPITLDAAALAALESVTIGTALPAGTALIGKVNGNATPGTPTAHRTAVVAADVVAAPGTVTCTKIAGGAATAGVYTVFVVAGNTYGRTTATQGNTTVTTETTNLTVRAAFAQVTGATFYDIFCSVDGAASKFLGRVTEAQRATGILITAQNTTGAGGTAGAVDCQFPGTGLAVNGGQVAQNTAFTPESLTGIDPSGAENLDINVTFSRTGDSVAGTLVLLPFYAMSSSHYAAGEPVTVFFGGTSGSYYPLRQTLRLPCRGRSTVVVVASIAGTGASVDLESVSN